MYRNDLIRKIRLISNFIMSAWLTNNCNTDIRPFQEILNAHVAKCMRKYCYDMQWCTMCIFLFLKLYNFINFYNFIKGIMCICTVFLKYVRPMFVYLLTCWNIGNRTVYLYLIKLASKVWKKNCPSFLYTLYKARKKSESTFSIHSWLFFLC